MRLTPSSRTRRLLSAKRPVGVAAARRLPFVPARVLVPGGFALVLFVPALASAHDGSPAGPPTALTALGLLVTLLLYVRGARRLHASRRGIGAGRLLAAGLAGLAVAVALLPPLDRAAGTLLSAHMAQHVLLTLVAAPLVALARPLAVVLVALPRAWRPRHVPGARAPLAVAAGAHAVALWAWHLPPLYDVALASAPVHALEHATLTATAAWLWWSATRQRPAGALALFATALHAGALGALLTLAPRPWFVAHRAGGAGLTALEDQQLAGIVMWVPAGVVLTGFALALLAAWLRQAERRTPSLSGPRTLALVLLTLLTLGCNRAAPTATLMTGGDPGRGRAIIPKYGCQTCHTIPGVTGADATVGPPLTHLAARAFVAGRSNSPDNLIAWIRHPQHQRPASPMPEMGVTEQDGRDIAAYLYTLR
jgi:cytochrome c oxidase assembly factor CtaG/cytochrome c2